MSYGLPDDPVPLIIADEPDRGVRIEFFDWECGHHGQCPLPIAGLQVEQVGPILRAISHAISQPGHARVRVTDSTGFTEAYITDDYVRFSPGDLVDLVGVVGWPDRPVIVHSAAPERMQALTDWIDGMEGAIAPAWNGTTALADYDWVVTALTPAELARLTRATTAPPPRLIDAADFEREIAQEANVQAEEPQA
jgi:hypothetical protein